MRLNWFSPLPPVRSAIAEYAAALLPALAARALIDLWSEEPLVSLPPLAGVRVRRLDPDSPPWDEINRAAMSVFHIGNQSAFHGRISRLSRLHPGVVVLHDARLHHLFAGAFRDAGDEEGYLAAMERVYGRAGREDGRGLWRQLLPTDALARRYPLTELAVERALGVLVHSEEAAAMVEGSDAPVRLSPLPYAARPRTRRAALSPPYRLVAFGHFGPNRRLEAVLEALAGFPRRQELRLDIFGEIEKREDFIARAESLGLAGIVAVHGFVAEDVLDGALSAAHLAVNLRNPSMGEASLSQLRIWDHALPALVSRVGWYATLPAEAVWHVRPEHEADDLQEALGALLAEPARFAAMGARGRQELERRHAPAAYVDALLGLVAEAVAFRPRLAFHEAERRAAKAFLPLARAGGAAGAAAGPPLPAGLDPFAFAIARHRDRLGRQCDGALASVRQAAARRRQRRSTTAS